MSVAQSELIAYCSANMPTTDSATSGGAIDPKTRAVFTDLAANDKVEVISTSASDTMTCTVVGRDASGIIQTEALSLTGTSAKLFSTNTFERIESVVLSADAVGTVTVRRQSAGSTISTITTGERGFRRLFYNAASDPSVSTVRYEKIFLKNTNGGGLALTSAQVSQAADPQAVIQHAVSGAVDDSGSVANRITMPSLTFDDTSKAVPGGNLAAGSAIGVWLSLTLGAGAAGFKSTYTIQLSGSSV